MGRPRTGRWVVLLREKVQQRDMRAHYYEDPSYALAICGIARREASQPQQTLGTTLEQCERADFATCASCRRLLALRSERKGKQNATC